MRTAPQEVYVAVVVVKGAGQQLPVGDRPQAWVESVANQIAGQHLASPVSVPEPAPVYSEAKKRWLWFGVGILCFCGAGYCLYQGLFAPTVL